jgi:hypothetical protein
MLRRVRLSGQGRWHAEEAADLLRLALAEADEDPRCLLIIAQAIIAARGGLDDPGLDSAETSISVGLPGSPILPTE